MGQEPQKKFPLTFDDYELYEEIGEGVSATVYRALCIPHKQIVAIKVLDLEKCNNDMDGIRREVQTMILIEHPNLLRAHCAFTVGYNLWVVMPFMAGGSCLHIMKSMYPDGFEEPVIATLLRDVLKALVYLHAQGHIHRDVKAGNILIDSDGSVKLADFGVAAAMFDGGDRQRSRNTFVGTPCWMAPEVMQQLHGYDFKVDIWSFGITALELAHGHAPFSKYPPMKVLLMTLQNAPPGLDYERDKRFSKAFKEMVAACLVKDPKKRPSAEKLLKHPFFKYARSSYYLSQSILNGIPQLGERFRMVKAKEADFLVQKASYEDKEHLSQKEYIRGISAWNFNLEDLKSQAAFIQDDPIDNSEDSKVILKHEDTQGRTSLPVESLYANQGDHDNATFQMENDMDSITGLDVSLAAFPVKPLQALKSCFDMHGDDTHISSSKDSVESDPDQGSLHQSEAIPLDGGLGRECDGDYGRIGPVLTVGIQKSPSGLLLHEGDLASKNLVGDEERDYLQPRASKEKSYGPTQQRLRKDFSSPTLREDALEGSVKYRGRFKVTSADVTSKVGVSHVHSGGSTTQVASTLSSVSFLPSLQYLLQQNTMQREAIHNLMKLVERTSGLSNELEGGTNEHSQMIPSVRERELQSQVFQIQQRIGSLVEELQRLKAKNAQLERWLNASADSSGV